MSCYGNYHGAMSGARNHPTPEERVNMILEYLNGNTRKALKLLARQYRILAIEREDDQIWVNEMESHRRITVTYNYWYVVKYVSFNDYERMRVFEWRISPEDIKY